MYKIYFHLQLSFLKYTLSSYLTLLIAFRSRVIKKQIQSHCINGTDPVTVRYKCRWRVVSKH
jgi:hypothetical protein